MATRNKKTNSKTTKIISLVAVIITAVASVFSGGFKPERIFPTLEQIKPAIEELAPLLDEKEDLETLNQGEYENSVTVIDIGQGKSSLIQSNGEYALIDAGVSDEKDLIGYLHDRGVETIEIMVISHYHADHYNRSIKVLEQFDVKKVVVPDSSEDNLPTTSYFERFLKALSESGAKVYKSSKGDVYKVGDGEIEILNDTPQSVEDINDTSTYTQFTQGEFIYLDTGDVNIPYELKTLKDVSKVTLFNSAHHGSSGSNSKEFISKINPEMIFVSAGLNNDYGHPHDEVVDLYNSLGIPFKGTYDEGSLVYNFGDMENPKIWSDGIV